MHVNIPRTHSVPFCRTQIYLESDLWASDCLTGTTNIVLSHYMHCYEVCKGEQCQIQFCSLSWNYSFLLVTAVPDILVYLCSQHVWALSKRISHSSTLVLQQAPHCCVIHTAHANVAFADYQIIQAVIYFTGADNSKQTWKDFPHKWPLGREKVGAVSSKGEPGSTIQFNAMQCNGLHWVPLSVQQKIALYCPLHFSIIMPKFCLQRQSWKIGVDGSTRLKWPTLTKHFSTYLSKISHRAVWTLQE